MNARKPCEYCAADLPVGVDRKTRRMRSHHFATCPKRPQVRGGEVVGLSMDEAEELLALMTDYQREALLNTLRHATHSTAPVSTPCITAARKGTP